MALPTTFGTETQATGGQLDVNFASVGALTTLQCTASGSANAITLTPAINAPVINAYGLPNPVRFGFVAVNTPTGAVTVRIGALAPLNLYLPTGGAQVNSGGLSNGAYYEIVFVQSLNSGSGGFVITSAVPSAIGKIVQVQEVQTGAVMSGSTTMPGQVDTIPTNIQGDQYLSLSITPTNATSVLIIQAVLNVSILNSAHILQAALYQDSTVNALTTAFITQPVDNTIDQLIILFKMTAATTSPTTFKIRAGSGDVNTFTLNGINGNRVGGGVLNSTMTITEVSP